MRLSVVIPATDAPATLERAVAAIGHAGGAPEQLIIISDPATLGPAAARNLGARQANGDILVFVDADVEVHADAFVRIRDAFDRDPDLAAVFGSYDDDPGGRGAVSNFRNLLHHHVHHDGAGGATTFWAGLGAVRRDVFLEIGGFDENRFPRASIEDIELGIRLHERSQRVLLEPAIQGRHLKAWSLASMTKTDLLDRGVPWLRLVFEKRASVTALNLGWRHRLSTLASLLILAGVLRRSLRMAAVGLLVMGVLERRFYGLLLRRRGLRLLIAGVPLHVVHRLTSAAAVPIALAAHLLASSSGPSSPVNDDGPSSFP
jgi:GT2 family glycosyltransferase